MQQGPGDPPYRAEAPNQIRRRWRPYEKEQTAFDARKAELDKVEENKTAKRRAKRQKLKAKKRAKKGSKVPVVGPSVAPAGPEGGPDRPGKPDPASKHVFTRRSKP